MMRPLFLLVLFAAGCHRAAAPPVGIPAPAPAVASAPSALEQLYRARQDSARQRFTPADVSFMRAMIGHHAQALAMANLAATNAADPSIRTLAARIHNAQRDEIDLMQTWLQRRGQAVPALHTEGWRVMVHDAHDAGHAAHGAMPGMLTEQQLEALAAARGRAFDQLFLRSMIEHHEGAVSMVDVLFATDGAAQDETVFKFASDVQVDQRTEVARMRLMLEAMRDTRAP
jgi:uncharacterized protein (DUF305 family)